MPLPTPHAGEKQDEFVSRCMASEAAKEFTDEAQRLAVCYSQFKKKDEKAGHPPLAIEAVVTFWDIEGEKP